MLKVLIGPSPSPSPCPANIPSRETLKLTEDGWIVGPQNELTLWLPFGLRDCCITDFDVINQVDFRGFKCGTEWIQCRKVVEP